MAPIVRKTGKAALFFIFLLLIATAAARIWLTSSEGQTLINRYINTRIPGTLTWEDIDLFLTGGSFAIDKGRLSGPSGELLISADRIYVNISWFSLIAGGLTIENAKIIKPDVRFSIDPEGNLNLMDAFPAFGVDTTGDSTEGRPFNLVIDQFSIRSGSFSFNSYDTSGNNPVTSVSIDGIGLNLAHGNLAEHSCRFDVETGTTEVTVSDIRSVIHSLDLKGRLKRGNLSRLALTVESQHGTITASGKVDTIVSIPRMDVDINLKTSLEALQKLASFDENLSGSLAVDMSVRGEIDNPDADLKIHLKNASILNTPVRKLRAELQLNDKQLSILRLALNSSLGDADVHGSIDLAQTLPNGITGNIVNPEKTAWSVTLNHKSSDMKALLGDDYGISGALMSAFSLEGKGISPETLRADGKLRMDASGAAIEDVLATGDMTLESDVLIDRGGLLFRNTILTRGKTVITGKGDINLSTGDLVSDLLLEARNYSDTGLFPGVEVSGGPVRLSAQFTGPLDHPEIFAQLIGNDVNAYGIDGGTLGVIASLNRSGMVRVSAECSKPGNESLKVSGTIQVFNDDFDLIDGVPMDLSAEFRKVDIGSLSDELQLSGRITGHGTFRGPYYNPDATLFLKGSSICLSSDRRISGNLITDLTFGKGTLHIKTADFSNNDSILAAKGSVRLLHPETGELYSDPILAVTASGNPVNLKHFLDDYSGTVKFSASLNGPASHPSGTITMTGTSLESPWQNLNRAGVNVTFDGHRININSCTATFEKDETVALTGWISVPDNTYSLSLKSSPIAFTSINYLSEQYSGAGNVSLTLSGKGSIDSPSLSGNLILSELRADTHMLDDIVVTLDLKDTIARARSSQGFTADAWVNINTFDFSGNAGFDKTSLKPLFEFMGRSDLSGNISGTVKADGNLEQPERSTASISLSNASIRQDNLELIRSETLKATFDNKTLSVPETHFSLLDKGYLTLKGDCELNGPLNFSARGLIPVEVLSGYAEDYSDMTGEISISASASDTMDAPSLRADIDLRNISMTIPDLMQKLHSVNGTIEITPRKINVASIRGNLDTGSFKISGNAALDGLTPSKINASFKSDRLPIKIPDTLDVYLNTAISVTGSPKNSTIAGTVEILEGLYYKDVSLNLIRSVGTRSREIDPSQQPLLIPILGDSSLDLVIKHRSPFDVDNNIAIMALRPNMRLTGTVRKPLVRGRSVVESGIITYQGRDFIITKGVIDFLNPYKIEPTIDIRGQMEIRQWTIFLEVSGTPENLEFKLTSDPHEGDWNILSLLAFGKTTEELAEGNSGATISTRQILADMVSKSLGENLKNSTGLDTVEMEYTNGEEAGDSDDIKVTVGKELSERMVLKYGVETKSGVTVQSAETEYRLLENLLMNTFQDTEGDFGGELIFRLEFR